MRNIVHACRYRRTADNEEDGEDKRLCVIVIFSDITRKENAKEQLTNGCSAKCGNRRHAAATEYGSVVVTGSDV